MRRTQTLRAVTVEIASLVFRISCRYEKPIAWARETHPAFLSRRAPAIRVVVVYRARSRRLPWIAPRTVSDVPEVTGGRESTRVRTVYYRAGMDRTGRRIDVTMAPGFQVDGLMRTLSALLLLSRGGLLVRAARIVSSGGAASLVLGLPAEERVRLATRAEVVDGFVALTPWRGGWTSFATPFHDGLSLERHPPAPVAALYVVRPTAGAPRRLGVAAAAALSPRLCVVDRRAEALERMLDVSARLVSTVPLYEVSSVDRLPVESHAGTLA